MEKENKQSPLEFIDQWLKQNKDLQVKLQEMVGPGHEEYDKLYKTWMSCTAELTQRLSEAKVNPFDTNTYEELNKVWAKYSEDLRNVFIKVLDEADPKKNEVYRVWMDAFSNVHKCDEDGGKSQYDPTDIWRKWFEDAQKNMLHGMTPSQNIFAMNPSQNLQLTSPNMNLNWFEETKKLHRSWVDTNTRLMNDILRSPAFCTMLANNINNSMEMYKMFRPPVQWPMPGMAQATDETLKTLSSRVDELSKKMETSPKRRRRN